MYGPPGTGKTFLAKACATESEAVFFSISASDIMSKYVGESEKQVKKLFKQARKHPNAIIFIDEIDSLVSARSDNENESSKRVKTEMLVQMQGVGSSSSKLTVIAATNLPWDLDPAIIRRFPKRIYIPLPDEESREYLIRHSLASEDHSLTDQNLRQLAKSTEGYSGSDLSVLVKAVFYVPIKEFQEAEFFRQTGVAKNGQPVWSPCSPNEKGAVKIDKRILTKETYAKNRISYQHFEQALENTKPSVGKDGLRKYDDWTQSFGLKG